MITEPETDRKLMESVTAQYLRARGSVKDEEQMPISVR